eukprot:jgi/Tetstr1/455617/TSEL_042429.t1
MVYAPEIELPKLSQQAKHLLQRAVRNTQRLPVRELQSMAGRARYMYMAIIPAGRFFLRELHDVVGSKWGGRVRMTQNSVGTCISGAGNERQHITWKEHKALRLAVESFLPHLACRRMLLHEGIRARYIPQSAANVWADRLSMHLDSDGWQPDPVLFAELKAEWGPTPPTASSRP